MVQLVGWQDTWDGLAISCSAPLPTAKAALAAKGSKLAPPGTVGGVEKFSVSV
jgi:hypothetical protein